jgi:hypothetical protein
MALEWDSAEAWDTARFTWEGMALIASTTSLEDFLKRRRIYLTKELPDAVPVRLNGPYLPF